MYIPEFIFSVVILIWGFCVAVRYFRGLGEVNRDQEFIQQERRRQRWLQNNYRLAGRARRRDAV